MDFDKIDDIIRNFVNLGDAYPGTPLFAEDVVADATARVRLMVSDAETERRGANSADDKRLRARLERLLILQAQLKKRETDLRQHNAQRSLDVMNRRLKGYRDMVVELLPVVAKNPRISEAAMEKLTEMLRELDEM